MRRKGQGRGALFFALLLLSLLLPHPPALSADRAPELRQATVLFTHDLHDSFLPRPDGLGGQSGGYARLAAALERERARYPDALTLDGGDFSMGSLFQVLYATKAPELTTMGQLGYDAATLGNHEFDYGPQGLAQMLQAAKDSGAPLPALLSANYAPAPDNPHREEVLRAMSRYGVTDSILLERGGVSYGIFGLMGTDSHDVSPQSGFQLQDAAQAARRCVESLRAQGAEVIIALSHSGTDENRKKSEDEQLALAVEGIDLIVSGHSHTTLSEPLLVNGTYIVSAGANCENLGSITLTWTEGEEKTLADYRLVAIDETLPEEPETKRLVEQWKGQVDAFLLSRYGYTSDQVLARSSFALPVPVGGVQAGNALGELISDAYRWAAQQAEGEGAHPVDVALVADGLLRAPLPQGEITTALAFDTLSLGTGPDGLPGYPLVSVWLTGRELKAVLEVDASVTPVMHNAQLYLSGVEYQMNTRRVFFNRVAAAALRGADGRLSPIEDERLYRMVSSLYAAQMLSAVKDKSMGLLSLEPKDAQGRPIENFSDHILYDAQGREVKEWFALAQFLASFPEERGVPVVPDQYAAPDGRKEVTASFNPVLLMKNANWLTWAAALVCLALLTAAGFLGRRLARRLRRGRYGSRKSRKRRRGR